MSPAVGGGVIVGSTAASGLPSVLPSASGLPRLHSMFADVLNKVGDRKLCVVGDSDSSGYNIANGYGWAPILANVLKSFGIPASVGLAIPTNPSSPVADSRVALGTGWNNTAGAGTHNGWGGLGAGWESTSTGTLVFTPNTGDTYDSYDIYYYTNALFGTLNAQVPGGVLTPINENPGGSACLKITVSGTAAVNQTLTITGVTGTCFIAGIEPFNSTVPRVRIGVASVNASSSTNWVAAPTTPGLGSLNLIQLYAANTWLLELGGDDLFQGVPIGQVYGNYSTLATAMRTTAADIVGLTVTPLSPTLFAPGASVAAYMNNLRAWCAANGAGFIDTFDAWGGANGFTTMPASYFFDALGHPSLQGLADIGRIVGQSLVTL